MDVSGHDDRLAERFRERVEESIRVKQDLLPDLGRCVEVARVLIEAYRRGRSMFLFGNGGSAADAQHIAAEFLGRFYFDRPAAPAHALTVNTSALTAISNDYSFEHVFARQLEALGQPSDVAVGISTSGNAANVLAGLRTARQRGMTTVALTGANGGRSRAEADYWVGVPSDETPRVQECHIMIGHIWSELVEAELFGAASAGSTEQANQRLGGLTQS
jgi:D-sedoheptulose 7-phosphate isomerase